MIQKIQSLKLFYDKNQIQVAIFAEPTESSDGWLCNLPCEEVFKDLPENIAFEVPIPLEEIRRSLAFQPNFIAGWVGTSSESTPLPSKPSAPVATAQPVAPSPISLATYCNQIARQTGLSPNMVRQACEPLLKGIVAQIDSGTPFVSWILTGTPDQQSALPAADGQPAQPARKFMRMEVTKGYKG